MNNVRFAQRQAVRPKRDNEVWYRARLLNIVKTARASVEPELRKFIKAAVKPDNKDLAHHLALTARNMIQRKKHAYISSTDVTGVSTQAPRIAARAATMNLDAVDRQFQRHLKQATGINAQFGKPDITHGRIVSTVHIGTGDYNPDQPREPAGTPGGGQWAGGGVSVGASKATLQARVDSATPVSRFSDVVMSREDHVYRFVTGTEYDHALATGKLSPGRAADTGNTVNFSKEPIPAYGGSAYREHGLLVEVPEAKLDNPQIYWGSKDLYAASDKPVPLSHVSRAWAYQFGERGLRIVSATDVITRVGKDSYHLRISDAAKVIHFPPKRYGSQQRTQALVQKHIAENVRLIKSIPSDYFDRIAEDIYENMASAQRWEVLADDLYETLDYVYGITQSRANLIARDQTSKMNAAFNEDRQTSVGITSYQWQTAGDERVRPSHAEKDGQVFDWDSPPEDTGHPGNDINCRCVALAQFEELQEVA